MGDDLTWMSVQQIRELIVRGEVSPVEVTDHFLGRIDEHQAKLKAFRHIDREGRAQAKAAERAVTGGGRLGVLHGIPVSVKEHIAVAGLPVLVPGVGEKRARFDDLGVARLRDAGAVIVGTNAMMGTRAPRPGEYNWDAEARNPWDASRVPGWSSSGGAATTAAALLPLAIGSDGGGSTRLPGAYSGVVALHPSAGLIPSFNYGLQARRNPTGTIGPMTRHVTDAAITLQAMAGPDGRDFDCLQSTPPDYVAALKAGVDGLRLGWTDDFGYASMYAFPESARVIAAVREAAKGFATLGAELDVLHETWEDFYPGLGGTMHLFAGDRGSGRKGPVEYGNRPAPSQLAALPDSVCRPRPHRQPNRSDPGAQDRGLGVVLGWHGPGTLPPQRLRAALHQPHPHVQLAWLPGHQRPRWICR